MSKNDFLDGLMDASGSDVVFTAEDLLALPKNWIDTGSYSLNALMCGSIYGGMPTTRITGFAGESATGKTFFTLGIVKNFLEKNPTAVCLYFDSEDAVDAQFIKERGIDPKRVAIFQVVTVEGFRTQLMKMINKIAETPEKDRRPIIAVLDSLGNLSTEKEITDIGEGKNVRDMTRTQVIKASFRALTVKLGQVGVPLIVTGHVYSTMELYSQKVVSGGSGLQYAASTILMLSKRKDKDKENDVVGNIIHCKTQKSRATREQKMIDTKLSFSTGLDRYYGLLPIAIKYGIFKQIANKIEIAPDVKVFESKIFAEPERFYTPEVLKKIDEACAKEFKYGQGDEVPTDEETDELTSEGIDE